MSQDHEHHRWKHDGVRVIRGDQLDANTPQTPGMFRQAAIDLRGSGRRSSGPARCGSSPTPRRACIITARWRA